MPYKDDMNTDLEFENHISVLSDRGLIEFVARQVHDISKVCPVHDKRLRVVEKQTKKTMGLIGGTGAIIGTAITATIDYFIKRG